MGDRDAPPLQVRHTGGARSAGVHLDIGRKHFPLGVIVALLRRMGELGLTELQLHVSENLGYRIASRRHPDLVSPAHLSSADLERLTSVADGLGIDIVPSLDLPGHARWILRHRPALRLVDGRGGWVPDAIDLGMAEARDLLHDLHDDLAAHFPASTQWHIGFDEIIPVDDQAAATGLRQRASALGDGADEHDALAAQANAVVASVAARGVRARVWNDAMLRSRIVHLDRTAIITWWTNWHTDMAPLARAIEAGHDVLNCNDGLLYFVLGEAAGYRYPTAQRLRETDWSPGRFPALRDGTPQRLSDDDPRLVGSLYSIWCDEPEALSPDAVLSRIDDSLAEYARRAVG